MHDTSARAYHRPHQRRLRPPHCDPSTAAATNGPRSEVGGAPTATTIGAGLDTSIVAAFLSGWLAQGGRARSPDGGRGTRKLPFISIVFTIKLLSRTPLRPAPAPARAAFPPKVPSGLTGRAPAWGA